MTADLTQSQTLAFAQLLAAMRRIARKPWAREHSVYREFARKDKGGTKKLRTLRTREDEASDPMWVPDWAAYEVNPCDCPKCIAIRVLHDFEEEVKRSHAQTA